MNIKLFGGHQRGVELKHLPIYSQDSDLSFTEI